MLSYFTMPILPESDVQTAQGFKFTRPLRTILDLIEAGTVERTFIRQATNGSSPDSTWTPVLGDVASPPVDAIVCRDWLGFAGIPTAQVQMIAREQQFAEKVHAYTLPRTSANSRVKDLVDMALLIKSGGLEKRRVLDALYLTFERRGTHNLPVVLVPPPVDWQIPFRNLAEECGLPTEVATVFAMVQQFLDEVRVARPGQ